MIETPAQLIRLILVCVIALGLLVLSMFALGFAARWSHHPLGLAAGVYLQAEILLLWRRADRLFRAIE
jgi:hypothetical protein